MGAGLFSTPQGQVAFTADFNFGSAPQSKNGGIVGNGSHIGVGAATAPSHITTPEKQGPNLRHFAGSGMSAFGKPPHPGQPFFGSVNKSDTEPDEDRYGKYS
ncbi:hypothetical protein LTR36_003237 [Oleoguttula mirabilis]|uniref:Uncharacterized protein n=1 Tax=Oleoguttula mirabilis TaxID=1507867 RepID=A0AAV9JYV7_9PEZI|nr:hypothetical protein LTR36_003237 [Oleoguttula mirabilis]